MQPLVWEHPTILHEESINRLWDLRKEIRAVVWARFDDPILHKSQRTRSERRLEASTVGVITDQFLAGHPETSSRRSAYETAQSKYPRSQTKRGHVLFYSYHSKWAEFSAGFDHLRTRKNGSKQPEYVVFGWLLTLANLPEVTKEGCTREKWS
jgi:hypothetical protein